MFTLYDYDANIILQYPLKSRQGKEIADAFHATFLKLTKHGHATKLFILDNECSNDLKLAILNTNSTFELVPPHQHRRNAAERAIRTAKNHLLAGIATCDPDFPITEWDRLLRQSELTLNLLRTSRINPSLSAWAYVNGVHNFNKVPLAPPGTKIIMHSKPDQRASWDYHGLEGFYVAPAPDHYRCLTCYLPKTKSEVIADTVKFLPRYIPIPETSLDDYVKKTADDLIHLLLHKSPAIPALQPESSRQALIHLAQVLQRDNSPTTLQAITYIIS